MNGHAWANAIFGGDNSGLNTSAVLATIGIGCRPGQYPVLPRC